jgi:hypothetical protein
MATVTAPDAIVGPERSSGVELERSSSLVFDWVMALLGGLFVGGLYIDGWAHNHLDRIETFFTPWHALFYGSFLLLAIVFGAYAVAGLRARPMERSNLFDGLARAITRGYEWSAAGGALLLLAGVGDRAWHLRFGIEVSTEALLSPTHLALATGMALILLGPFRAAVVRGNEPMGSALWPAVISLTLMYCGLTFMTQFAPAMGQWGVGPQPPRDLAEIRIDRSITVQLLDAAILSGVVLLALRQWGARLPFGAITAILVINSLLMETQQGGNEQLLGIVLAGLASDTLIAWLQPSAIRVVQLRWVAFAVPFLYFAAHYATYWVRGYPIYYKVHIWAGLPFIAGLIGLLLSFLAVSAPLTPRGVPADTRA